MYQSSVAGDLEDILISHSMSDALEWLGLDSSMEWPAGAADRTFELG